MAVPKGYRPEERKKRPCLKCDRYFLTTKDKRICPACSDKIEDTNLSGGISAKTPLRFETGDSRAQR